MVVCPVHRDKDSAVVDAALVIACVLVTYAVVLEVSSESTGDCACSSPNRCRARDRGRCNRACRSERANARDGECRNAEDRANTSAGKSAFRGVLARIVIRDVATAVADRSSAFFPSDNGKARVINAGAAKLTNGGFSFPTGCRTQPK